MPFELTTERITVGKSEPARNAALAVYNDERKIPAIVTVVPDKQQRMHWQAKIGEYTVFSIQSTGSEFQICTDGDSKRLTIDQQGGITLKQATITISPAHRFPTRDHRTSIRHGRTIGFSC